MFAVDKFLQHYNEKVFHFISCIATALSVNARRIDSSFAETAIKSHLTQDMKDYYEI